MNLDLSLSLKNIFLDSNGVPKILVLVNDNKKDNVFNPVTIGKLILEMTSGVDCHSNLNLMNPEENNYLKMVQNYSENLKSFTNLCFTPNGKESATVDNLLNHTFLDGHGLLS
jgi:hypothetical protein